jgi:hypothetical protein
LRTRIRDSKVEVEALSADMPPIEALTVLAVVEHLEAVVGELARWFLVALHEPLH